MVDNAVNVEPIKVKVDSLLCAITLETNIIYTSCLDC